MLGLLERRATAGGPGARRQHRLDRRPRGGTYDNFSYSGEQGRAAPPDAGARAPPRAALDHGELRRPRARSARNMTAALLERDETDYRRGRRRSGACRTPPTWAQRSSISPLAAAPTVTGCVIPVDGGLAINTWGREPNDRERAAPADRCSSRPTSRRCSARRCGRSRRRYGHRYYLECSRTGKRQTELWADLGRYGFLGVNIPSEYGGADGGHHRARDRLRGARGRRHPVVPADRLDGDLRRVPRPPRQRGAEARVAAADGDGRDGARVLDHRARRRLEHAQPVDDRDARRATSTGSAARSTTPRRSTTARRSSLVARTGHRREDRPRQALAVHRRLRTPRASRCSRSRSRRRCRSGSSRSSSTTSMVPATRLIGDEGDGLQAAVRGPQPRADHGRGARERDRALRARQGGGVRARARASGACRSARIRASPIRSRRRRSRSSSRG